MRGGVVGRFFTLMEKVFSFVRSGTTGRQVLLFALFGGVQLLVDWAVFVVLTWLETDVTFANLCGRVIGAVVGFSLNGRFTFRLAGSTGHDRLARMLRFLAGWALTAALSTALVWLTERQLGLQAAWLGKLVIDAAIAVVGFALSKYWIFR